MSSDSRSLKIMAYVDGELEGAERAEVEAWLAEDPSSVCLANEFASLGSLLKAGYDGSASAAAVASFDLADAIMASAAKVPQFVEDAASQAEAPQAPVISLASARARRPEGKAHWKKAGFVVAGLALAASVFFLARSKNDEPMARGAAVAAPSTGGTGVDVYLHETLGQSVGVFYSESSLQTTSVVVWVDETGAK